MLADVLLCVLPGYLMRLAAPKPSRMYRAPSRRCLRLRRQDNQRGRSPLNLLCHRVVMLLQKSGTAATIAALIDGTAPIG